MAEIDIFTDYYLNQIGTGVGSIYAGPAYQKGYGIGSFLGGLFRGVFPLLKKTTKAVGSELLKSGVGLLSDLTHENPEAAMKKRGKEMINNLSSRTSKHLFGSGYTYKGLFPPTRVQSTKKKQRRRKRKVVKKRKTAKKRVVRKKKPVKKRKRKAVRSKRTLQDIFA